MAKKHTAIDKPSISIVGPGSLGSALALELACQHYPIRHIVSRPGDKNTPGKTLARRLKAEHFFLGKHLLDSDIVWLTVPDDIIACVASQLSESQSWKGRTVLHSSGALTSEELAPLWEKGALVASIHPMMTFVTGKKPSWRGVSFAVEGDEDAARQATQIALDLGGRAFAIERRNKVLYHAFGAFASPLVIALMSAMEQVAEAAGIPPHQAKQIMQPLLAETLNNYLRQDAASAFSGPLKRGDVKTVSKHLVALKRAPEARDIYLALARAAIKRLPVKNREALLNTLSPSAPAEVTAAAEGVALTSRAKTVHPSRGSSQRKQDQIPRANRRRS